MASPEPEQHEIDVDVGWGCFALGIVGLVASIHFLGRLLEVLLALVEKL